MSAESTVLLVLGVFASVGIAAAVTLASKRRAIVTAESDALARLVALNERFAAQLRYPAPISYAWEDRVTSKSKFDRYDLHKFFLERLIGLEQEVGLALDLHRRDVGIYSRYKRELDQLEAAALGRTLSKRLSAATFERIERKLFSRQRLPEPACHAQVRCSVSYTTPQGRNSYRKSRDWDFEQLAAGLQEMRTIREAQTTTAFLRQQERNRMTARLRFAVLNRDDSRCRGCGASAKIHGAVLHVDHIVPVSKGGKTVLENLQTLCEPCNLGKSNKF
ncbi:HNH endonuclease [Nocardioides sediminis]|uniref:HNH endonuclease n=1 Tax=Nocardioides sediminis TaxID=433648 RepID=UPI000D309C6B|nr:HNH endonuclease signature motif containing protein [Nocardioides sediminis]